MARREAGRTSAHAAFSDEDYELVCNSDDASESEPETVCNMGTEPSMKYTRSGHDIGSTNERADQAPAAAWTSNAVTTGRTGKPDIAPAGATTSELDIKPTVAESKQAGAPAPAATATAPVVKSTPAQVQASANSSSVKARFINLLLAPSLLCVCLALPVAAVTSFYAYDNQVPPAQFYTSCFTWLWHAHFMYLLTVLLLQAIWAGFMTAVTACKQSGLRAGNALMPAAAAAAAAPAAQRTLHNNRAGPAAGTKSLGAATSNKPPGTPPAVMGTSPRTGSTTALSTVVANSSPAPPSASAVHRRPCTITISMGSAALDVTPLGLVTGVVLLSLAVTSVITAPSAAVATMYRARASLSAPSTNMPTPAATTIFTAAANSSSMGANMTTASAISTLASDDAAPVHKWAAVMALVASEPVYDKRFAQHLDHASGASMIKCLSKQFQQFHATPGKDKDFASQALTSCTVLVRRGMRWGGAESAEDIIALAKLHKLQCFKAGGHSTSKDAPHSKRQATAHTAAAGTPPQTSQAAAAAAAAAAPPPQAAKPTPARSATAAAPAATRDKHGASPAAASVKRSADPTQPPQPAGNKRAAVAGPSTTTTAANATQTPAQHAVGQAGKSFNIGSCSMCKPYLGWHISDTVARCLLRCQLQQLGCHQGMDNAQAAEACIQGIQTLVVDSQKHKDQYGTNSAAAQAPRNTSSWQSGMQHIRTAFQHGTGAAGAAVHTSTQRALAAVKQGANRERMLAAVKLGTQSAHNNLQALKQELDKTAEHLIHAARLRETHAHTAALTAAHTAANLTRSVYSTVANTVSTTAAGLKQRLAATASVSATSGKQLLAKFMKPKVPSSNMGAAAAASAGNSAVASIDNVFKLAGQPFSNPGASVAHTFTTAASAASATMRKATKAAYATAMQQAQVAQQHSAAAAASAASAVQSLAGQVRQAAVRAPSSMHAALAGARNATRRAVLQKPAVHNVLSRAKAAAARAHARVMRAM